MLPHVSYVVNQLSRCLTSVTWWTNSHVASRQLRGEPTLMLPHVSYVVNQLSRCLTSVTWWTNSHVASRQLRGEPTLTLPHVSYVVNQLSCCLTSSLFFNSFPLIFRVCFHLTALNIKLLEPLAQGASRFEKSLAPPKIHWPPIFPNDVSPSKTVVDIKTLK